MAHPFERHETAPMIALVWGNNLASIVSALIVDQPGLASRLVLAPRRVVHTLAAYIHHAIEAQHEIMRISNDIEQQEVRALLSEAVMNPHPRLYRILDRLGPTALDFATYKRLNDVLHGPAGNLLHDNTDEITGSHLSMLINIVADPVLLAARRAIMWSEADLRHLKHALKYLRAKGLSKDIENLPHGAGWKAILRRISSDIGRARAPTASFAIPSGWRQVEDVAGLWRVGTALGNCVSSFRSGGEGHIEQFIAGDAIYLVCDEPMMLACIRNVGPDLWTLSETTTSLPGSDIMKAKKALRFDLITVIAKTGGALLDNAPLSAIRSIAWRTNHGADEDTWDDLDDVA